MNTRINFFLNGQEYSVNSLVTVTEILHYFDYNNSLFVVEYNNLICSPNDWSFIKIDSNDKIEIITIVGGG